MKTQMIDKHQLGESILSEFAQLPEESQMRQFFETFGIPHQNLANGHELYDELWNLFDENQFCVDEMLKMKKDLMYYF